MDYEQARLVQASFEVLDLDQDALAGLFYGRLFELDPSMRAMFHGDMLSQGRKLVAMLRATVKGLDDFETVRPAVLDLGRRHARYGVVGAQYATMKQALLWALECQLGERFDAATCDAWRAAYDLMAATMQAGARQAWDRRG